MSLKIPGFLGTHWYVSETASVVTVPHRFCFKYQISFEASSDTRYSAAPHALFLVSSRRTYTQSI